MPSGGIAYKVLHLLPFKAGVERQPPSLPPSPLLSLPAEGPLSQPPAGRRGVYVKSACFPEVVEGLNQSRGRNTDKLLSLAGSLSPLRNGNSSQPGGAGGAGWGWAAAQQPGRFWSPGANQLFPPHPQKQGSL